MLIKYNNITIRNAKTSDASQLSQWWNDGSIMKHAGFPNGLNKTVNEIVDSLKNDSDLTPRSLMIEVDDIPIGEMSFKHKSNQTMEIGIKICDVSMQNRGYGKIILSLLILELFNNYKYKIISLDTNLNNKRAQHVYEKIGFIQTEIKIDSWKNQLGELQSAVYYELVKEDFVDYSKNERHKKKKGNI